MYAAADQPGLMRALRLSTSAEHGELESALDLLSPNFTLACYRGLLGRFLGYYDPWESACAAALGEDRAEWFNARRKSHLLRRDLEILGSSKGALTSIPMCTHLPPLDGLASAFGSMYVIEGSTLGGQVLARHFRSRFGLQTQSGAEFFHGYGECTGKMWASFGTTLEQSVPPSSVEEAIRAARTTFQSLHRWLAPTPEIP